MASYYKFTTAYTDGTTRNLQIGAVDTASIPVDIKQKIIDFNDQTTRNTQFPGFDNAFVSEGGAAFTAIKAAEIITTTRTYYF